MISSEILFSKYKQQMDQKLIMSYNKQETFDLLLLAVISNHKNSKNGCSYQRLS
jgi:hypothetical protein